MKLERLTVGTLLEMAKGGSESVEVPAETLAELCKAWLALDAAPVARIGNSDAFSCFLEKPQGSEAGPVHAMLGQRVRLVTTNSAGGE